MLNTKEGENPFPATYSGYGRVVDGSFVSNYQEGHPLRPFHEKSHNQFVAFVKSPTFPCVFGLAAVNIRQYAFNAYGDMTAKETAQGVLHDMVRFQNEFQVPEVAKTDKGILRTFLAAFQTPKLETQLEGAEALYRLMANMHELNSQHYDWPEGFSNQLDSNNFGFGAGRAAHFIAHFYPGAAVPARVSELNFAVFNSHSIVAAYKEIAGMDKHAKAKEIIRSRQVQPVHPALGNFGDVPDFPQYTLLDTDPVTQAADQSLRKAILGECPFKPNV